VKTSDIRIHPLEFAKLLQSLDIGRLRNVLNRLQRTQRVGIDGLADEGGGGLLSLLQPIHQAVSRAAVKK
jgi:hypothetical protein